MTDSVAAGGESAEQEAAACPHGCRPTRSMEWADDSWFCPACKDEWPADQTYDEPRSGRNTERDGG